MKKAICVLTLLMLITAVLFGCSDPDEQFTEKSYTPDAEINEISIDVRDREIEVTLSLDGTVHIDYFESDREHYDISVSGGVLTIMDGGSKDLGSYFGVKPSAEFRKISLAVPDTLLTSISISTTNESISLAPLSVAKSVSLTSNGGDISVSGLDAGGSISLSAKNGDISGTISGSYDDFSISCETKKGDCNLPAEKSGGEKSLKVSCNNGDVNLEFSGS